MIKQLKDTPKCKGGGANQNFEDWTNEKFELASEPWNSIF